MMYSIELISRIAMQDTIALDSVGTLDLVECYPNLKCPDSSYFNYVMLF